MSELISIKNWEKFKELAKKLKPKAIIYSIDKNGNIKNKEPTEINNSESKQILCLC